MSSISRWREASHPEPLSIRHRLAGLLYRQLAPVLDQDLAQPTRRPADERFERRVDDVEIAFAGRGSELDDRAGNRFRGSEAGEAPEQAAVATFDDLHGASADL